MDLRWVEFKMRWRAAAVRIMQIAALCISLAYACRVMIFGDKKQPRTLITRYRWGL